ncbi:hypothetical protein ACQPXM_06540 [Kribbella sp. CA-253562]|uniref:hypothetical protein n=1 Tax=Kribbella sp. CA-253562 TaxID=3239942 RepID=UPI003D8D9E23
MWEFVLWGMLGGAANRGVNYLEAAARVKGGKPWRRPKGPGGGAYLAALVVHLFIAGVTAGAASTLVQGPTVWMIFGIGAVAPAAVKKAGQYALALAPSGDTGEDADELEVGEDDEK